MKNLNRHLMKTKNNQIQKLGEKKMKVKNLFLGLVVLSILSFAASASADVPQMINYQGVLTDTAGCPVDDGYYSMTFSIYDDTLTDPLWTGTFDLVYVKQGNFSVLLGSDTLNSIPFSVFLNAELWLGIQVDLDGEMRPLQRIASVGYAFHSQFADTADHCWTMSDDDWDGAGTGKMHIHFLTDKVGIGTTNPIAKLHVEDTIGTAIYGRSEGGSGVKYGGRFYGLQGGTDNIGVLAFGGCDALPCTPGSHSNIGIWAIASNGFVPSIPSGDWAGYFNGDVKIVGNLDVEETIKLNFDYDTTFSINPDQTKTVTHSVGGDASKYIVFMDGISSDGGIHQSDFGTACYGVIEKCVGCEWFGLTSSQIKVYRAADDDDMSPSKDWDQCRIRILKNQ